MKQIKQMLEHLRSLTFDIKTNKTPPAQKKQKKPKTKPKSHHALLPSESFLTGERRNNFYINNNHD